MIRNALPRRTILRGIGTAMALPFLDAMLPSTAYAASKASKKAPLRMAFLYVPNGIHMKDWTPATDGADYALTPTLQPLAAYKDDLLVMSGLAQHNAFALGDGGGDHARAVATFLTGVHPKKTSGADISVGVSVDQLAAQHIGRETRFSSLEIGCERGAQAGNCDSGYSCAYSSNLAWSSPNTPVAKETNPKLVFERLFGNGESAEMAESRARRERYRKSVLDFVMEDASQLKSQLGAHDQRKLDEYFTGIRELEIRVANAAKSDPVAAGVKPPTGIPQDYGDHMNLLSDMLALAFQGDLTRVSTFMFANDGSNRPYRQINISEGHHDLSHHGNNPDKQAKLGQINKYHIEHFAYLLNKLKNMHEGEGTVLDNCMVLYGACICDGDRHNHDDLPILLAGKGGGTIKSGRHVSYQNPTPLTNLFLCMLDRLGMHEDKFGDSSGRLENLI